MAKIRHELYYGDPQKAKNKLNGILEDEDLLPDYPEAEILQAEIYVYFGEIDRARLVIRDLFRSRELPGWLNEVVQNISVEYDLQFQLPEPGNK